MSGSVGNWYDKYGSRHPVERWLMAGFLREVTALYLRERARTVLEVGCGEGHLAQHLVTHGYRPEHFEATDLSLERCRPDLDPVIQLRAATAYDLPYHDRQFDLVICCEVLEHLNEPVRAVRELSRVCNKAVIVSTPAEPLFRALNLLRGAYLRRLGNTPGHVQHFSRKGLVRLLGQFLRIREVRTPVPWTVVLASPL